MSLSNDGRTCHGSKMFRTRMNAGRVTMRGFTSLLILIVLAGCTTSSVVPFSQDTVQISVADLGVMCGRRGVNKVAFRRAAIETIKRGYDDFVIVDYQYEEPLRFFGTTAPQYATVPTPGLPGGLHDQATIKVGGGDPIYERQAENSMVVRMFKADDNGVENARGRLHSARGVLGRDWRKRIAEDPDICLD